jgi:hypothetical protein
VGVAVCGQSSPLSPCPATLRHSGISFSRRRHRGTSDVGTEPRRHQTCGSHVERLEVGAHREIRCHEVVIVQVVAIEVAHHAMAVRSAMLIPSVVAYWPIWTASETKPSIGELESTPAGFCQLKFLCDSVQSGFRAHGTAVIRSDVRTGRGREVGRRSSALVLDCGRRSVDRVAICSPVGGHLAEVVIKRTVLLNYDHHMIHCRDSPRRWSARAWSCRWRGSGSFTAGTAARD